MKRGDVLTVIFLIGDRAVRLRRTIDTISDDLRSDERLKLLAALSRIEHENAQLLSQVQGQCPTIDH